jgi:hypothetical protein
MTVLYTRQIKFCSVQAGEVRLLHGHIEVGMTRSCNVDQSILNFEPRLT